MFNASFDYWMEEQAITGLAIRVSHFRILCCGSSRGLLPAHYYCMYVVGVTGAFSLRVSLSLLQIPQHLLLMNFDEVERYHLIDPTSIQIYDI